MAEFQIVTRLNLFSACCMIILFIILLRANSEATTWLEIAYW